MPHAHSPRLAPRPTRARAALLLCGALAAACNPSPDAQPAAAAARAPAPAASRATTSATTRSPAPATAPCRSERAGAAAERELAICLVRDVPSLGKTARQGAAVPVVLYVDRSGSMRGFLDPAYSTRRPTDFRAVLDRLVVGLHPRRGFSYGASLRPVDPTLATFNDRAFYSDRDTQVETVLGRIAADTAHAATHIIVGDGRRGSPNAADAQYVGMRQLAEEWTAAGGAFLVGTSMAPFQTVATDPSGCRAATGGTAPQTCPLYAFAFVAPGADGQVRAALAASFEHVFASPQTAVAPTALAVVPEGPTHDVDVNRRWATGPGGATVVRVTGPRPAADWATLRLASTDSASADGRATAAFLRGQGATVRLLARAFRGEAAGTAWQLVGAAAPVRAHAGTPYAVDVITRGPTAPAGLYRVDFLPTGEPSWLADFDATDATDRLRTYGLGRLFEASRQRAVAHATDDGAAVARLLLVIN